MGREDRDDMRHRRSSADQPYWPPRTKPIAWGGVLAFVVVLYLGFEWLEAGRPRKASPPNSQPSKAPTTAPPARTIAPLRQPEAAPELPPRLVIKCVGIDGSTSYVDAQEKCAEQLRRREVMAIPRQAETPTAPPSPRPAHAISVQAPPAREPEPAQPVPDNRQACAALDELVNWIDAEARQPLPPWRQDQLRADRKAARDKQFALHC